PAEELDQLGTDGVITTVGAGSGCQPRHHHGYFGPQGILELLGEDDPDPSAIHKYSPAGAPRAVPVIDGLRPLREEGLRAIPEGPETRAEILGAPQGFVEHWPTE